MATLLFVVPLLVVDVSPANKPGGGLSGEADPMRALDAFFGPLEQAWGVDIEVGKIKLELLSGQFSLFGVSIVHPKHGKILSSCGLRFPLGVLASSHDSSKSAASVDGLDLSIDFGKDQFWKTTAGGGKPIPGAPDIRLGMLKVDGGSINLANGPYTRIKISGFSGDLHKLEIDGKTWSAGKVPDGKWVEAKLTAGTMSYGPIPEILQIKKGKVHLESNVLHIDEFRGELKDGGTLSMDGRVEMAGGSPSRFDLHVKVQGARIDKHNIAALASGDLTIAGSQDKVKIAGKLSLTEVARLEPSKWSFPGCKGKTSLAVSLLQKSSNGASAKKSNLKGTLCKGRLE